MAGTAARANGAMWDTRKPPSFRPAVICRRRRKGHGDGGRPFRLCLVLISCPALRLACLAWPLAGLQGRQVAPAAGRGRCASPQASAVPAGLGWPSCPPGLRPVFFRSDRDRGGGFADPSPDGGMEEFRDVFLSRSSSPVIRSRASSPRSDTTSAASTSQDGGS
jgi:hypothetical protein